MLPVLLIRFLTDAENTFDLIQYGLYLHELNQVGGIAEVGRCAILLLALDFLEKRDCFQINTIFWFIKKFRVIISSSRIRKN